MNKKNGEDDENPAPLSEGASAQNTGKLEMTEVALGQSLAVLRR